MIGIAHARLGDPERARAWFQRAVDAHPSHADSHNNLGNALRDLKRENEAAAAYARAIALNPDQPQAHYNRGNALAAMQRDAEAAASFNRAIALKPDYANAHRALGDLMLRLGRLQPAMASFLRTVEFDPDNAHAHNNLGNIYKMTGRTQESLPHFRRSAELRPNDPVPINNLGNALTSLELWDEALACYRRAVEVDPDYGTARGHILHINAHICDWDALAAEADWIPKLGIETVPVPTFIMLAAEDHLERHRLRSERLAKERYARPASPLPPVSARAAGPIRIGYFSADYHNHATMYLMARLFEHHDRERFTIHAYSYGPDADDEMRRRLRASVDVFHDIRGLGDRDAAMLARSEGIDIAVDLKGYTQGTRAAIFAWRPAPIAVNFLGYPGSMGADFIDYIIADPVTIPPGHRRGYAEKIITLPDSYQPNDESRPIAADPGSRADHGLPEQGFVFACFNNCYKITADAYDIWMRLLGQVEGSVLWLLRANGRVEANLRRQAEKRGIDPARILFAEKRPVPEHLARHAHADLFLDTFNYNAHTTASDALWAGLPVVTRCGESFAARVAASLLTALGLPELITHNSRDYQRLALELATDPGRLAAIRARLWRSRTTAPLFDSLRFTRNLEQAYAVAFERYAEGLSPEDIEVSP
jgi:predicted O-linked N-acetylglucosamine transferase (SPINDLY family)